MADKVRRAAGPLPSSEPKKKSTAKKTTARKTTAAKTTAKKTTAKKSTARKTTAKKTTRRASSTATESRATYKVDKDVSPRHSPTGKWLRPGDTVKATESEAASLGLKKA